MEYKVIKSNRKTISLEIKKDGAVLVRAPFFVSENQIEDFVLKHQKWIESHKLKVLKQSEVLKSQPPLTQEELNRLFLLAKEVIPQRVRYYADVINVKPNRISFRRQKTRWGSCSAKGNLNFNCLLMLAPLEVIDSVVVHELCHLKQMNHSKNFYKEVLKAYPEYKKHHRWLKENGDFLIARLPD